MSLSFGEAAREYEAGRPGYPMEAVRWVLEPLAGSDTPLRALDVGAGTGKLTRSLVGAAVEVTAVEPDQVMLDTLVEALPGVAGIVGSAEHLPVQDAAFDAALYGQVWHWLDEDASSAEATRALRPSGVLGLIWNVRDTRTAWVAQMVEIMRKSRAEQMFDDGGPWIGPQFGIAEHEEWSWSRQVNRAQLEDLVRSRSYVITASADERQRIEVELAELFDAIGAVGDAVVDFPYVTRAYRALRP